MLGTLPLELTYQCHCTTANATLPLPRHHFTTTTATVPLPLQYAYCLVCDSAGMILVDPPQEVMPSLVLTVSSPW